MHLFDDHDFGSNNADARSPSKDKANGAYRSMVRNVERKEGIYHTFEVKGVKFIVLDGRSLKT